MGSNVVTVALAGAGARATAAATGGADDPHGVAVRVGVRGGGFRPPLARLKRHFPTNLGLRRAAAPSA